MALATYADLKASMARWLARDDLTTPIPDFIRLCHTQLMRDMRGHLRLQKVNPNFAIGDEYVAVPADFLEFVSGYTNTSPRRSLAFMPGDMQTLAYGDAASGVPLYFSLGGGSGGDEQFRFSPTPAACTATIQYYAKLPFFTSDAAYNWILTDYPDLYLYGSCYFGAVYLANDGMAANAKALYRESLNDCMAAGRRARWGGSGMAIRPA